MAAGAAITVKKKGKGAGGRQAKLTASGALSKNTTTQPSPFAEPILPNIPEFCAEKPKKAVRARKLDPAQKKLDQFAVSDGSRPTTPEKQETDRKTGGDDEVEPLSLTERLKKKGITPPSKQTRLKRKRPPVAAASVDLMDDSDSDETGVEAPSPPPRRDLPQRKTAKSYVELLGGSSDEEEEEEKGLGAPVYEEEGFVPGDDSSDEDFSLFPKKKRAGSPSRDTATSQPVPPAKTGSKRPAPMTSKQRVASKSTSQKSSQKTLQLMMKKVVRMGYCMAY